MTSQVGLIGLGTMGAALALNIAEKGHDVVVFNRTTEKTHRFVEAAGELRSRLTATETLAAFVAAITAPRTIILMVPAGDPVDEQITALLPLLDPEDLIVDAGNANFRDTNRRMRDLDQPFLGIGVSGGEEGARHGPAIMVGGPHENFERVRELLRALAAKHEGEPCADWMGEEGAGHFVKAVHNGIEYADMQLIAEIYGVMRDGQGLPAGEIGDVFARWNEGPLRSYLVEITAAVARAGDAASGGPLLDVIVDAAGQKGTGRWTAIEAQHLGAAIPVIEAAVAARNMSAQRSERAAMQAIFGDPHSAIDRDELGLDTLEAALLCAKILCYDQGFRLIAAASETFGWSLDGARIARVWREGCIIRSDMLGDMAEAFVSGRATSLMAAPTFAERLARSHQALREVVICAVRHGLAAPALSAALGYFDTMRTSRGTANMIQGQRDYFGRHGFARLDDDNNDSGSGRHGPWAAGE